MRKFLSICVLMVLGAGPMVACGSIKGNYNSNNQSLDLCDEVTNECDTAADNDGDGISNGDEGTTSASATAYRIPPGTRRPAATAKTA